MANKIPLAVADFETQLSTPIEIDDVAFSITSGTDDDGTALPAGKYCFTIDNGKSNKEYLLGQLNGTDVTAVVSVSRQGVETSGANFPHRVGANVVITDFATIQRVADILRGQVDLDGTAPIGYDAEPTLADRKDLATVGFVLDTATGTANITFESQTLTGNAGESVSAGELVYFKTSDQEWYKTDADTAATVDGVMLGIALGSGTDGAGISNGVLVNGIYTTSALTAGSEYYASNTAGAYSTSAGTTSRKIGVALSSTKLFLYAKGTQDHVLREDGTVLTLVPHPVVSLTDDNANTLTINSNTVGHACMYSIPNRIVVNSISFRTVTAATPGTSIISLFSEDGQTRYFSVTSSTLNSTEIEIVSVPSVEIRPGNYYLVIQSVSTTSCGIYMYTLNSTPFATTVGLNANVTGEPVLFGTLTVTADTAPTTISPTAITAGTGGIIFRIDN